MAKKKAAKKAARTKLRKDASKGTRKALARKTRRAADQTFPELGNLKDAVATRHAKAYADAMYQSEEALVDAEAAKQSIRNRMHTIKANLFSAHGYVFTLTPGDEIFKAAKQKRGSKPQGTLPSDAGGGETGDAGDTGSAGHEDTLEQ